MNDFLMRAAFIAPIISTYALLTKQGTPKTAFATLFTANTVCALVVDGHMFMHITSGLTALIAAAGFIRETRKQVA